MAQTVEDLGRMVKSKYPGQYDDLGDADLGRKVRTKYPGSYDDFVDTPTTAIPNPVRSGTAVPSALQGASDEQTLESFKQEHPYTYGALRGLFNTADISPGMMAVPGSTVEPAVSAVGAALRGGAKALPGAARQALSDFSLIHPLRTLPSLWDAGATVAQGARAGMEAAKPE